MAASTTGRQSLYLYIGTAPRQPIRDRSVHRAGLNSDNWAGIRPNVSSSAQLCRVVEVSARRYTVIHCCRQLLISSDDENRDKNYDERGDSIAAAAAAAGLRCGSIPLRVF